MVGAVRIRNGRSEKTTFLIVDAQSVKNTDMSEHKSYDSGKEISGIRHYIAVDTRNFPDAIAVTAAGVPYRKGALEAFTHHKKSLLAVVNLLADVTYTGQSFADGVAEILGEKDEIAKRNELHTFTVLPQRRVVECSFGWLEKCRRLSKNCKRQLNTSLKLVNFSFLTLILY